MFTFIKQKDDSENSVAHFFFSNATFGSGVCQRYALNTLWLVCVLNLGESLGEIQA